MNKIAQIILEITAIGWIVFVIIAIVMTFNSCKSTSISTEKFIEMKTNYKVK